MKKEIVISKIRELRGRNPYEILGFTSSFVGLLRKRPELLRKLVEQHKAYLLAILHPDVVKEEDKKIAEELSKIINEAYSRIKDRFEGEDLIEQYMLSRDLEIKYLQERIDDLERENRVIKRDNERLKEEISNYRLSISKLIEALLSFSKNIGEINKEIPCLIVADYLNYKTIYFVNEDRILYEIIGKKRIKEKKVGYHIEDTLKKLVFFERTCKIRRVGIILGSIKRVDKNRIIFTFDNFIEIKDFLGSIDLNLKNNYIVVLVAVGYNDKTKRYFAIFDFIKVEKIIKIEKVYQRI